MLVNRDVLIGEMLIGGYLGHSDHEVVTSSKKYFVVRVKFQAVLRARYLVSMGSAFEGIMVHHSWSLFKHSLFKNTGTGSSKMSDVQMKQKVSLNQ